MDAACKGGGHLSAVIIVSIFQRGIMLYLNFKENCFNDMTDEELVRISAEDRRAVSVLIARYAGSIWLKAKSMSNMSVDADDLVQEGLLGFLNAVSKFRLEYNSRFSTFAEICILNRMKTLISRNYNTAAPVDDANLEKNEDTLYSDTPESILIQKEHLSELYHEIISLLSKREWEIFRMFLKGMTYKKIAEKQNITVKSVDNAMQRIRRKLKSSWNKDGFADKKT